MRELPGAGTSDDRKPIARRPQEPDELRPRGRDVTMQNMHRVKMWPAKAHIRAGDADRERAANDLTRHCADGRLTPGELEQRLDAVFGARTLGELAAVRRDLPATAPAQSPRRPGRLVATVIVLIMLLTAAIVGSGVPELAIEEPLGALLALMLLVACVLLAVVVLGTLLVTLAPLIALGVGIRWLAHRLLESRGSATPPPWSLRA